MGELKPREKCGVFGYYGRGKASEKVYLGLHNIQHRGQESCGICSYDNQRYQIHTGMGIVNDIFNKKLLDKLNGHTAIGHARYSTKGSSSIENSQPLFENEVALAHNGEIRNYEELKELLYNKGKKLTTTSDSEVFLRLLNQTSGNLEERVAKVSRIAQPSYAMVILGEGKLIGIRDRQGVRPLEIAKTKSGYALSSETVGFDIIEAEHLREVRPGEMVVIDENGLKSHQLDKNSSEKRCIFEMIYFSRPDSFITQDTSIGMIRREFGKELYKQNPIEADIVSEVPDSSFDAAYGVSLESNIRYDKSLVRSHYIGRTFIEPSQELRDAAVLKKFNVNRSVVKDKRIILVDDSIVRGTTLKDLVGFIKKKGAKEVHVMISSPPYLNSCKLGVDTSDETLIIARNKSIEEIRAHIGSDSLTYLEKQRMLSNPLLRGRGFCTDCFDKID
jgi:amidophosphoribosyltransferase